MPAHGGYPERPRAQCGARPHKAAERRVAKRRAKLRVVSSGPRLGPVSRESSAPLRAHGPEGGGGAGPSGVGRGPSIWAPGGMLGGSEADDDVVFLGERGAAGVVDDDCRVLPEGPAPLRASEGAQQERRKRGAGEAPRSLFCVECGSGPFKDAARLRVHCVSRCKKRTRPPSRARAPSAQKSSYGAPNTRKASPPPPRVWARIRSGRGNRPLCARARRSAPSTVPPAWARRSRCPRSHCT